jgi:catechol 2,3-dioxygenase-like lactoylglutathione lyase family enzyme
MPRDKAPFSPPCLLATDADLNPDYLPDYPASDKHGVPMKILAANTVMYCKRWQQSVHFYRDILKLHISFSKDDWFIEFSVNGAAHLSIADASRCSIAPGSGVGLTLSFLVADLRAMHAFFRQHAIATTEIRAHSWRAPYFYVHDPEGTRIEFWARHLAAQT